MSRRDHLEQLHRSTPAILPSLLLCDFGNLEREVRRLEDAGVPALHLDVMDGNFVPNLSYGMPIVAALRRLTHLPLDVHLMIDRPERFVDEFHAAGADIITVHVEATPDPVGLLRRLRTLDVGVGIALNPATPLQQIEPCLELCDLALVMSVPAGFGGQAFQPVALEKLRRLAELTAGRVLLEVDGGVNGATIQACAQAGARVFVVGSAIFRTPDYGQAVRDLTSLAIPG